VGIDYVITVFGNVAYAKFADLLALSLQLNGGVPRSRIFVYDNTGYQYQHANSYFLETDYCYTDEGRKVFPARLKTNLHLVHDNRPFVYLDADTLCIGRLDRFEAQFVSDPYRYRCQNLGYIDYSDEDTPHGNMLWANRASLWEHFKLDKDRPIAATNSSIQYFGESEIMGWASELLEENPYPTDKMPYKWGRVPMQPDELYLNVAWHIAEAPPLDFEFQPIYFQNITNPARPTIDSLRASYPFLGLYTGSSKHLMSLWDNEGYRLTGERIRVSIWEQDKLTKKVRKNEAE
jgi:hypothetical protein